MLPCRLRQVYCSHDANPANTKLWPAKQTHAISPRKVRKSLRLKEGENLHDIAGKYTDALAVSVTMSQLLDGLKTAMLTQIPTQTPTSTPTTQPTSMPTTEVQGELQAEQAQLEKYRQQIEAAIGSKTIGEELKAQRREEAALREEMLKRSHH